MRAAGSCRCGLAPFLCGIGAGLPAWVVAAPDAMAGAWPLPPKTGLTISSIVASPMILRGAGETGDPQFATPQTGLAFENYGELGLTKKWTLITKFQTTWEGPQTGGVSNSGEIGVSRLLARRNHLVLSWQNNLAGGVSAQNEACEGARLESRLALGWSGKLLKRNSFWTIENGGRVRADGCIGLQLDSAFGIEPVPNRLQFISQLFIDLDRERAGATNQTVQLQQSMVVHVSRQWSVQLGGRFGVTQNVANRSVILALWRRF